MPLLILRSSTQEILQETFAEIIENWYKSFLVEKWNEEEGEKEEGEESEDEYEFSDQPSSSPRRAVMNKRKLGTFYADENKRHCHAAVWNQD